MLKLKVNIRISDGTLSKVGLPSGKLGETPTEPTCKADLAIQYGRSSHRQQEAEVETCLFYKT